jgi:glycine/D-amino acid oxidase-like deaminating enzyme/nitrite reductase/ring-hydroxylating ferredoxin subunit
VKTAVLKPSATESYWSHTQTLPKFPRLDANRKFDVVVVGAGITGITTAYLLKQAGMTVGVLERGRCAGVDTSHTSAHLTCVTDTRLADLVDSLGQDHARAVWDAGLAAIAEVDEIVRREQIECGFAWVPAYLHVPVNGFDDRDEKVLLKEAAVAEALGFDARYVERAPFVGLPAVEYDGQARLHPRKYLGALLERIDGDGSAIFEETGVDEIETEPLRVHANGHQVSCDDVVVATHNPIVGTAKMVSATMLQTKLALYTSYVLAARVERERVPDVLLWDTANPYTYIRLDPKRDDDVVVFGGHDHKTGQVDDTRDCLAQLEADLHNLVPEAAIEARWSGQVIETTDGLPFIGYMAPHQFAATGYCGNGMTFGTVAAIMARDALTGRRNPWADLFDMQRSGLLAGAWDYLKENKDYAYYLIRDRFAGSEGRSLRSVPRNSGKVLTLDGKRVAAYRGPDGTMTVRSAVCTHMGCLVKWNAAETTWDCPCHGSRFKPTGEVLAGPAETPLPESE